MNTLKKIAVFCGSNSGSHSMYAEAAKALAFALLKRQLALVYGGASVGLMGILADTMLSQSGEVIGVIPSFLSRKEIVHTHLTKLVVVETMHERKAMISESADGFILLPGGVGSLDEFFEMFTWQQLGQHHKPCGILNVNGYYDTMVSLLDHMVQEGFLKAAHRENILIDSDPDNLIEKFFNFSFNPLEKSIVP